MRRLLEHFRKTSMALASKSSRLHVVCDCDVYDEWTSKSYGTDEPIVYKDNIYLSWGPEGTEADDIPGESVHWEYICNCIEPPVLECVRENYDSWGPINYNSDKKVWWGNALWKSGTSGAAWSDIPSRSSSWVWVCGEIPPTPTPTPTTSLTPTPSPTEVVVDDCNCEDFGLWESRRYEARERVCWKDTTEEGVERSRIFEAYDWEGTDATDVPGISIHWREICSKPMRFFFKIVSQSKHIGFLETDVEDVCIGLFNETVKLTRNASRLLYSSSGYLYPVPDGSELYMNPSSDITYQFEDDDFYIEEDGQWAWAGGFFYQLDGRKIVKSIACSAYEPVDCETTPWSSWSTCVNDKDEEVTCAGGTRFHTREIVQKPMYGGKECPELKGVEDCNTEPCPVDCIVSAWSGFGECLNDDDVVTCGGGTTTNTRTIISDEKYGGKCPERDDLVRTQPCATAPCPRDCEVSDWIPTETDPLGWGECSKPCDDGSGPGTQERHREIVDSGCCGGIPCPDLTDSRNCNVELCPEDCVVSDWSGFGECLNDADVVVTCGGGTTTNIRTIISDEKYGGKCPERDDLVRTQPCATDLCSSDCVMGDWKVTSETDVDGWGVCSEECGGGYQTRTRDVIVPSVGSGKKCLDLEEKRPCNGEIPCPCDAECISVSGFGAGSAASTAKWNGVYKRKISNPDPTKGRNQTTYREYWESDSGLVVGWIMGNEGTNHTGLYVGFESEHSMWSGGFMLTQNESFDLNEYESNAKFCPYDTEANWQENTYGDTPVVEAIECPVDCVPEPWPRNSQEDAVSWSECSEECGGGYKQRKREIKSPAKFGGKDCTEENGTGLTVTQPCDRFRHGVTGPGTASRMEAFPCPCDSECICVSGFTEPTHLVWNGAYRKNLGNKSNTAGTDDPALNYREYWQNDAGKTINWYAGSNWSQTSGGWHGGGGVHTNWGRNSEVTEASWPIVGVIMTEPYDNANGLAPSYKVYSRYCPYDPETIWKTNTSGETPVVEACECPIPVDCEVSDWYVSRTKYDQGISGTTEPDDANQWGGWCRHYDPAPWILDETTTQMVRSFCGEPSTWIVKRHAITEPEHGGAECPELEWVRSCLEPCECRDENICITGSNAGVDDNYKLGGAYSVKVLKEVVDSFTEVDLWIHHGTHLQGAHNTKIKSTSDMFMTITRNYWVGNTNGRVIYWDESAKWRVGTADDLATYIKTARPVPNPSEDFTSKEPTLKCPTGDRTGLGHTWVGVDWDIYLHSNYDESDVEYTKTPVAFSKWNNFGVEPSTEEGVQIQVLSRQGTVTHSTLDKRVGNKSSILFPGNQAHLAIPQIPCPPVGTLSGPPGWRCSGSYFTGGRSDYPRNDPERYGKLYKSVFAVAGHDFTWEFWFNISAWTLTHTRAWGGPAGTHLVGTFTEYSHPTNTGTSDNFYILVNGSNKMHIGGRGIPGGTGQTPIELQRWYHFAFVKKDGVNIGYLDGKKEFEFNWDGNLNMRKGKGSYIDGLTFGYRVFSQRFFLDEFKYVKGKALYDGVAANIGDSVFEPPTEFANIPPSVSKCGPPTDCEVSEWNHWVPCLNTEGVEVTCGTGEQKLTRHIITSEENGGSCPEREELEKTQICATDPCPVDCVASEWNWSGVCLNDKDVEVTCGEAKETATRTIVSDENITGKCPERSELEKTRPCTFEPCWDPLGPICVTNNPVEEYNGTYIWGGTHQFRSEFGTRNFWRQTPAQLPPGAQQVTLRWQVNDSQWGWWEFQSAPTTTYPTIKSNQNVNNHEWPWEASWGSSGLVLSPNDTDCHTDCVASDTWTTSASTDINGWSSCPECLQEGKTHEIFRSRKVITPRKGSGAPCSQLRETKFCDVPICPWADGWYSFGDPRPDSGQRNITFTGSQLPGKQYGTIWVDAIKFSYFGNASTARHFYTTLFRMWTKDGKINLPGDILVNTEDFHPTTPPTQQNGYCTTFTGSLCDPYSYMFNGTSTAGSRTHCITCDGHSIFDGTGVFGPLDTKGGSYVVMFLNKQIDLSTITKIDWGYKIGESSGSRAIEFRVPDEGTFTPPSV